MRGNDRFCGEEGLNGFCHFFAQEITHTHTHTHTLTHTHTHTHTYIYIYICLYLLGAVLTFVIKACFDELSAKILQKSSFVNQVQLATGLMNTCASRNDEDIS